MIKYNFILIYRSFKRNKGSFFINLIGLSSGLACALLIFLWVNNELSVDRFFMKEQQLYQVLTTHPNEDGIDTWRQGPIPLAPALAEEMPEVEITVNSSPILKDFTLSYGNEHFNASGHFVDKNYFSVFPFSFIQGNPVQAMVAKNSIVISESMALKLFHTTENVLGKLISWESQGKKEDAVVSGVFKDTPDNSSVQFDFAASFEVYKDMVGQAATWGNHQANSYLVLKDGTNVVKFEGKIVNFIQTKDKNSNVTLLLQKYSDQYLYNRFENGVQAGGRIDYVRLFLIIAILILVIACINFMNLTTAKSTGRIREVGIKKAIGAGRRLLVVQLLAESITMAVLSFIVAIGLVLLILPQFNVLTGKHLSLIFDQRLIIAITSILLFTGLAAGSYPALYLTGFRPAVVLKGRMSKSLSELFVRKGLVVFQFVLSVLLIVSVVVIYKQTQLIQTHDLGFNRNNVIQFKLDGKLVGNPETFLSEVKKLPAVKNASSMWGSIIGETGVTQGSFEWEGKDPNAVVAFSHLGVNYGLLELLGIQMKEGRSFSSDFSDETSKIIINEAGIAVMGLKDPVGKTFKLWGTNYEIVGVAKNFNFQTLHEKVKPLFFRFQPNESDKILVKAAPGKDKEVIREIASLYKAVNPGFVFDYNFLDNEYQKQYEAEQRITVLSQYFAGLAILISCLGLFGLSAFAAEQRVKEIGIRKVNGARISEVMTMLNKEFVKGVAIAFLIASPIAYYVMNKWLENFAYKTTLSWWIFALAGILALGIALLTVSWQSWRAATRNPIEALRYE